MRDVSNTDGFFGYGETPGQTGDSPASSTGKNDFEAIINKANTVPLVRIFKHYGLHVDAANTKLICPFKFHKGGHENTASFQYYPHTDTFYCHGCKSGNRACNFVSKMESISVLKAAFKILNLFAGDASDDAVLERQDFSERLEIMMEFSNIVREFRKSNLDDRDQSFIENMCLVYDTLNLKHKLDNDALREVVARLKEEINSHTPCLIL